MATIGLDKLYYSKITEDANGNETYGSPIKLAKAINADLSVEPYDATLFADDSAAVIIKEFKKGTITLGIDDIGKTVAADLIGATVDNNGVLVSNSEDAASPVAVGFRAKSANGHYRYFWLYRVVFAIPGASLKTKGDSIEFSTPSIEGTFTQRNKVDAQGKHPWKTEVTEGDAGVSASTITNWFTTVYEPSYASVDTNLASLSIGSVTLTPTFSAAVTSYTATTSNATNTVSAVASSANATVAITVNGTSHTSGSSATWTNGENTVNVVVTNGSSTKTYTVIVTKEN